MVFPWLVPYHALAINILIWGLFALGFNLLYGYAGLLSFGHAALLGVGSYGCGIAIVHLGWPWYVAILCGIAFAVGGGATSSAFSPSARAAFISRW